MRPPCVINDPDLGYVTILSETHWLGRTVRLFNNDLNFLCVGFWSADGGTLLGQPVRFKEAGALTAADFPGVDPAYFVTNGPSHGGGDGSITNG